MSRYYEMSVEIFNYNHEKQTEIEEAAEDEWEFDEEWYCRFPEDGSPLMSNSGRSYLTGGESEEEFTQRLTEAVWKANEAFCRVVIIATCLEEIPCETHELDKNAYQAFLTKENGKGK